MWSRSCNPSLDFTRLTYSLYFSYYIIDSNVSRSFKDGHVQLEGFIDFPFISKNLVTNPAYAPGTSSEGGTVTTFPFTGVFPGCRIVRRMESLAQQLLVVSPVDGSPPNPWGRVLLDWLTQPNSLRRRQNDRSRLRDTAHAPLNRDSPSSDSGY